MTRLEDRQILMRDIAQARADVGAAIRMDAQSAV